MDLHEFFAIRAANSFEVLWGLDDRAENTCAELLRP